MKKETAIKFVHSEIEDLGYSLNDSDVKEIAINAIELAEIASKKEVTKYLEEMLENLPQW